MSLYENSATELVTESAKRNEMRGCCRRIGQEGARCCQKGEVKQLLPPDFFHRPLAVLCEDVVSHGAADL
jgi:hypothetical protein